MQVLLSLIGTTSSVEVTSLKKCTIITHMCHGGIYGHKFMVVSPSWSQYFDIIREK